MSRPWSRHWSSWCHGSFLRIGAQGFYSERGYGQILINTEGAQGVSFEQMVNQQQLAAMVAKDPNVESFFSSVGSGVGLTGNTGRIFIKLKPREDRNSTPMSSFVRCGRN